MDNTINGRTPEEIKRSLKCRAMWGTPDCKMKCDECGTYVPGLNGSIMAAAAIALIQQLGRERDAAVEDILPMCTNCKHEKLGYGVGPCPPIEEYVTTDCSNWQWRGVQEVE
jgi:hypothetical protein